MLSKPTVRMRPQSSKRRFKLADYFDLVDDFCFSLNLKCTVMLICLVVRSRYFVIRWRRIAL